MKIKGYYWAIIAAAVVAVLAISIPYFIIKSNNSSNANSPHSADQLANYQSIDYAPVIAAYQDLINENPSDTLALDGLGNTYMEMGKYKEAKDVFEKASAVNPNEPLYYAGTGEAYSKLGMTDLANREIEKGLALDPNSQILIVLKGDILATQGKTDEAKALWKKAYDIDPNTQIGVLAGQLIQDQPAGSTGDSSGSSSGSSNPHETGEIPLN